jgi:hypothetical protein
MPNERTERIRDRAHEIWKREGQPEGRDVEHWQSAVAEIEAEESQAEVGAPAAPASKQRRAKGAPQLEEERATPPEAATGRVAGPDEIKQEGPVGEAGAKKRGRKG